MGQHRRPGVVVGIGREAAEVGFFVGMNNTGGPIDVWAVMGINEGQLIESGNGFRYYPAKVPPSQITRIERPADDAEPGPQRAGEDEAAQEDSPIISLNPLGPGAGCFCPGATARDGCCCSA
jgi:hypothetical protein